MITLVIPPFLYALVAPARPLRPSFLGALPSEVFIAELLACSPALIQAINFVTSSGEFPIIFSVPVGVVLQIAS